MNPPLYLPYILSGIKYKDMCVNTLLSDSIHYTITLTYITRPIYVAAVV